MAVTTIRRRVGSARRSKPSRAGRPRSSDLLNDSRPRAKANLLWLISQHGDTPVGLAEKINAAGLASEPIHRQQISQALHRMPLERTEHPAIIAVARYYGVTTEQLYREDLAGGGRVTNGESSESSRAAVATSAAASVALSAAAPAVAATAPSPAGSEIDQFLATARKLATLAAFANGADDAESGPDADWLARARDLAAAFRGLVR